MSRNHRKSALSDTPIQTDVESLSHDGRGVSHIDGKAVFIDGALPGETVELVYTSKRRDYAEARATRIIRPAAARTEPRCAHYGVCGGCSFQHVDAAEQVRFKQGLLVEQFKRIGKLDIPELWEPLCAAQWGYRHKARLGVKFVLKKDKLLIGFREKRSALLADIGLCPVLIPAVGEALADIAAYIGALAGRDKIPQIEVAAGDRRVALVVRILAPLSDADCEALRQLAQRGGFEIYLQPQGPDSVRPLFPEHPEALRYSLPDFGVTFEFKPGVFTQVNPELNRLMVARVVDALQLDAQDTVLDLFCGLGNFTLPLAKQAGHVVGVEGDPALVALAQHNAALNGLDNVEFFSADLTQDVSQQAWAQRHYDKVLLDPSRAGALEALPLFKIWRPDTVVYVSCNPATLARDAGVLVHELGYRLCKAGVMDMFPHTAHVESLALFVRAGK